MGKKSNSNGKKSKKPIEVRRTSKRNSPIPSPVLRQSTFGSDRNGGTQTKTNPKTIPTAIAADMIAKRAYLISISGNGGTQDENWFRAERELRAGK